MIRWKNITDFRLINMFKVMIKILPGVQLLAARQSFNMIKNSLSIIAQFVQKITVSNVKRNFTLI